MGEKLENLEFSLEVGSDDHKDATQKQRKVLIYNRNNGESIELVKDWTDEEERKLRWKLDFTLMPILWLGFFALQMDRGNLGNAKTSTLLEDIGMNQDQFNVGSQLMSAGIVVFEVPSNIILQKVGPRNWLSAQVICWSLVATFQSFNNNYALYLATRLLLGIFESGYIPGSLYMISNWWTRKELSLRHSIFFTGNLIAAAVCPLISAAILRDLTGKHGWSGWRWLFMIQGLVTFFIGIIYALTIPESPDNPSPFWSKKIKYFNSRERHILKTRVLLDDPNKFITKRNIVFSDVKESFLQWRIWIHWAITIINTQDMSAVGVYTPSIIKSFGFDTFKSNAYSSIGYWVTVVAVLVASYISDKTEARGAVILVSSIWQAAMAIVLRAMPVTYSKNRKFAIITLFNAFTVQHVLNTSWLSVNIQSPVVRNIGMAIIIMGANTGGITGGQMLRGSDAPLYHKGFTAILICQIIAAILVAIQILQYFLSNRRLDSKYGKHEVINATSEHSSSSEVSEDNKLELFIVGRKKLGDQIDSDLIKTQFSEYALHDIDVEQIKKEKFFRYCP